MGKGVPEIRVFIRKVLSNLSDCILIHGFWDFRRWALWTAVCQLFILHRYFLQLPWREISILPVQWHALCLGLFASIIAPFGGFFASGFKRAFKIKDFGDSIPGHGGITDRMDCQVNFKYIVLKSVLLNGKCTRVLLLLYGDACFYLRC